MKIWTYIRFSLKSIMAGWQNVVFIIVGLPLVLALFMGGMQSTAHDTDNEIQKAAIFIEDEDQTNLSKNLVSYLKSDDLSKFVEIENEKDSEIEIIIPKGYEKAVSSMDHIEVIVDGDIDAIEKQTVNNILDSYHEGLYISSKNLNKEELSQLSKESVSLKLDKSQKIDELQESSYMSLGLMAINLIYLIIVANYLPLSKSLAKRTELAPISRNTHFALEALSNIILGVAAYSIFIIIYSVAGFGYEGILLKYIPAIVVSSMYVVAMPTFIIKFFSEKWSKFISSIMLGVFMMVQMILDKVISSEFVKYCSPGFIVSESFRDAVEGNIVSGNIIVMAIIAIVLFIIANIKTNYDWRAGK